MASLTIFLIKYLFCVWSCSKGFLSKPRQAKNEDVYFLNFFKPWILNYYLLFMIGVSMSGGYLMDTVSIEQEEENIKLFKDYELTEEGEISGSL